MIRAMTAMNMVAAVFSVIWLVGHVTVRIFDWEFWFALGYAVVAILNVLVVAATRGRSRMRLRPGLVPLAESPEHTSPRACARGRSAN